MEMKRFYLGTDNNAYVELEAYKVDFLEKLIEENARTLDQAEFGANENIIKAIIGEENFESAILY